MTVPEKEAWWGKGRIVMIRRGVGRQEGVGIAAGNVSGEQIGGVRDQRRRSDLEGAVEGAGAEDPTEVGQEKGMMGARSGLNKPFRCGGVEMRRASQRSSIELIGSIKRRWG